MERDPSTVSAAVHHNLQKFGHVRVKPVQAKALQTIIQGWDVFESMPTGYGKVADFPDAAFLR